MEKIVRLRTHHILCLLGFRGLGYNAEFTNNMTDIHSRVFSGDAAIRLVEGWDDICSRCPKDGCITPGARDNALLLALSLRPDVTVFTNDIYERVAKSVTTEDLNRICNGCQWLPLGYCVEGLNSLCESLPCLQ